jgi:hypothetical protein
MPWLRFTSGERTPGTHWIGDWVGPRAGLDAGARRKILCPCRGSNLDRPIVQPVVRHYTAWATAAPAIKNNTEKIFNFFFCNFFVIYDNQNLETILLCFDCSSIRFDLSKLVQRLFSSKYRVTLFLCEVYNLILCLILWWPLLAISIINYFITRFWWELRLYYGFPQFPTIETDT